MLDKGNVLVFTWRAYYLEYLAKLVVFVVFRRVVFKVFVSICKVWTEQSASLTWKQWLALCEMREVLLHHTEQLCKDAAHTPYIYFVGVSVLRQYDLRCSVPPGDHMLRQLLALGLVQHSLWHM
jgi:hypothetical protein